MKKKVLVAMSGGVDSSVAAAVLMNDYEVTGATMKLFTNEDIQLDRQKTCCRYYNQKSLRTCLYRTN